MAFWPASRCPFGTLRGFCAEGTLDASHASEHCSILVANQAYRNTLEYLRGAACPGLLRHPGGLPGHKYGEIFEPEHPARTTCGLTLERQFRQRAGQFEPNSVRHGDELWRIQRNDYAGGGHRNRLQHERIEPASDVGCRTKHNVQRQVSAHVRGQLQRKRDHSFRCFRLELEHCFERDGDCADRRAIECQSHDCCGQCRGRVEWNSNWNLDGNRR